MSHKSTDEKEISSKDADEKKIKEYEDELKKTKYNKRTQHHVGLLKAKIAALKEKKEQKAKGAKKGEGYSIRKSGDATVVFLGFPSVGKSTLLNSITNANSKVGAYDFTTLDVIPGLLKYKGALIQLFDIPGIVEGASVGKGRGKEILSVIRAADLIVVLVDALKPNQKDILIEEINSSGIRLNKKKPDIKITRTEKGGVNVGLTVKLDMLDKETIKDILKEFKFNNADVLIREKIDVDQLIDVVEGNKAYIRGLVVLNKADLVEEKKLRHLKKMIKPDIIISAAKNENLEQLKEMIFRKLGLIRIFLKDINQKPDMEKPLIMHDNDSLGTLCNKIHNSFAARFRFARIWGDSARFEGQKIVKLTHTLKDKDIVELHLL